MSMPGFHDGRHYTDYVEQVNQLKKEKRFDETEQLLISLVGATEAEDRIEERGVAPWYYEQLALIYRKNKDLSMEQSIFERFESQRHSPGKKPETLMARLTKIRETLRNP
jgi:hypothetical protein